MGLSMNFKIFLLISCLLISCSSSDDQIEEDFYKVDSFTIHNRLAPYEWQYVKVELPQFVTFASFEVEADTGFGKRTIKIGHFSNLPMLCLRKGGLPLPEISSFASEVPKPDNIHNASEIIQNLRGEGQCYFIRDKISIEFTTEQIPPDVFFVGLFNGIGPMRTQAKMINAGPIFYLSTTIYLKDCKNQSLSGQLCNQSVEELSCHKSSSTYKLEQVDEKNKNYTGVSIRCLTCKKTYKESSLEDLASKTYFLNVPNPVEELMVSGTDLKTFEVHHTQKVHGSLMCYARYGTVPGNMSYDYAVDLTRMPLKISRPRIGTWYFKIQPIEKPNVQLTRLQNSSELLYLVEWDVLECPDGNAGANCAWPRYMLQVSQRDSSDAFLVYLPELVNAFVELHNLHLEPILSNTSYGIERAPDFAWIYFDIDVPRDACGKNIRIELIANASKNYQLFIRYNGLPSETDWDFYINQSSNSDNGSSMFKLYEISERRVDAYLLYPKEGLWSLGLRHAVKSNPISRTLLSLSVENCPNQCSNHGHCEFNGEQGPTNFRYYFCKCDGRYGGFDCSVQLVSSSGQRLHVVFLTASNAAALLPAVFALHHKAYAEWIVFICSGVSSALYHCCDTGSWCSLSFQVLQFMDFWLSFVAVLTTFLYLAFINEDLKRAAHTISFIVTALIALNGVTNSKNIPLVLTLGAFALLCAWFLEVFGSCRSTSSPLVISSAITQRFSRLVKVTLWFPDLLKTLNKRFHWRFVIVGLVALAMAALSWNLETPESYWIWHSTWHVSIYSSAFFFLCSRSSTILKNGNEAATEEDDDTSSLTIQQTSH